MGANASPGVGIEVLDTELGGMSTACFESVAWMNGGLVSLTLFRLSSIEMEVPLKKEGGDGRKDLRGIGCEVGALRRRASIGVEGRGE